MKIRPFQLERYFAKYEFTARHLLSSSDCDGVSLDQVLNCADETETRLWNDLRLGYTESQGLPQLREAIARQYRTIAAADVVVLSPGEANFCLMNVVLEKGDHVVCMSPMYQSLYQVAESIGCHLSFWKPDEHTWHYSPADLRKLITDKTKLLVVNFPHNPTGFLPTTSEVREIIDIAREHNLLVFSDEMYHQLVHDPARSIPPFCDLYENAVSLWGMAKTFGLAGLRIGWLASRNKVVLNEVMAYKDYLTICNNVMSEILTLIALNHKEKFIGPNIQKILDNIGIFSAFQHMHSDLFDFLPPVAGSTAFIRLNVREPALDYCERLAREAGIMLLPSEMFDYGDRHARVGFGREQMPEALAAWGAYIMK